jgi:exosortase A
MQPAPSHPSAMARLEGLLPVVLTIALVLLLFRDTAVAMVSIWQRSETFAHAFLVPPIVLWLVWRRRAHLAALTPRAAPWTLVPIALACFVWLLAELAGVNAAAQFALVGLLVLSVPALFGWAVARELMFPLAFLFFAVPFGDFMVDPMMDWTADFTVAALRISGVPVYREGLQFVIPSGNWSVVEACSGVRYLIASFMVGTLFAYLNYNSLPRRIAFVAVSLLVPIVANWLRAYMIVMIGHLSNNRLAVGTDHLLYGWVFFGIVIMLMFMIGARFTEPELPAPAARPAARDASSARSWHTWGVAAATLAVLAATQALVWRLDARANEAAPQAAPLPVTLPGGWALSQPDREAWVPHYQGANATLVASYRREGREIAVWLGHYRDQGHDRKMVTSTNMLVEQNSLRWLVVQQGQRQVPATSGAVPMRSAALRSPADPKSTPLQRVAVLYTYRIDGRFVTGHAEARLRLALQRLLGQGDDGAVIFFHTAAGDADEGAKALEAFVAEQLPRLTPLLDPPPASRR